jgi:hypothetical protein
MNPASRTHPQDSHVGPKSTGGKASATSTPANAHLGEDKPGIFDKNGAVGHQFQRMSMIECQPKQWKKQRKNRMKLTTSGTAAEGAIGSVGEAVGGPLSSQGMIGKQFTDKGSVGGTIQSALGGKSTKSN